MQRSVTALEWGMSKERELLNRSRYNLDREYCADLIDEIQELLAQAEQDNIQYLLDQVARLTAENAMLKEKWSTPKPESIEERKLDVLAEANITDEGIAGYYLGFKDAEKHHGIGVNDE